MAQAGGRKRSIGGKMEGKYVYCVIESDGERKSFGNLGFRGQEVYTIVCKDFAAVVSDSPIEEYDATGGKVEAHRKVAAEVMKDYSVLPVAYGMVFKNKKILLLTMRKARKAMRKAMKAVKNKVELGVKVVLPNGAPGWDGKRRDAIIKQCESDFSVLKKIAAESKKLRLFSDRLILNASFLVDRDKIDEFSGAVGRSKDEHQTLKIQYSGPWPPYNFVDIHILGKQRGGFR